MDEWVPTKLADLVEIKHGFAFKGEYFFEYPPGDFLLTSRPTLGCHCP